MVAARLVYGVVVTWFKIIITIQRWLFDKVLLKSVYLVR